MANCKANSKSKLEQTNTNVSQNLANLLQTKTKQCPEERYDDTRAEKIRTQSEAFSPVRNVILNFVHRNLQF